MNKLVKSQYLFVQSKNRSCGSAYNFDIDFQNRYIECEDDEVLAITLVNFNMFCDWYVVNENNNSFNITRVSDDHVITVNLPYGNYPYKTLYQTINTLVGASVCSFNKIKNKFVFTFNELHTLTFNNNSYEVLGFSNSTHTGTIIMSDVVLNPVKFLDNVCIHLNGVQPYRCYNLSNTNGNMEISNMLCAIPFTSAPYDIFSYSNQNDDFKLYIYNKSIQKLNFRITDFDGNDLTYIPDINMCLRVDTYIAEDEDETLQTLRKILEYTRMSFLSKHLR